MKNKIIKNLFNIMVSSLIPILMLILWIKTKMDVLIIITALVGFFLSLFMSIFMKLDKIYKKLEKVNS
jgi:hypothetical protein